MIGGSETKRFVKLIFTLLLVIVLAEVFCTHALAITESEVEAQVAASSKAEVSGNVLIWFLCAVAFLKVSQKIDSFMATLGVNVGRTGGSLLAEAMVAMRAVTMVVGGGGRGARGGGRSGTSGSSSSGADNSSWFLKGGLAGVVSRHVTNSAVKTATAQTSAVHTAQSSVRHSATAAASTPETSHGTGPSVSNDIHTGGVDIQAGGGAAAGVPPQEGVIITGGEGSPSITQSGDARSDVDQFSGAVLNIPQADASIPDTPGPGEASHIVSQAENVAVSESIAANDGGTVLNIPQGDSAAPIGSGSAPVQEGVIVTNSERQSNTQRTTNTQTSTNTQSAASAQTVTSTQAATSTQSATNTQTAASTQSSVNTQTAQTSTVVERSHTTTHLTHHSQAAPVAPISLGGAIFSKSLAAGGSFANDINGTVARGEVAGSITGDMAVQSLTSYMGYAAIRETARDVPRYDQAEIGQGRITGVETPAGGSEGIPFAMYHVGQYTRLPAHKRQKA